VFMAGRALIGIAIGGFWSMSAATAMRLVAPHRIPEALALVNGGNALATVVAAPLGSFLGGMIGWRWAFFSVVPVAALAFCWKLLSLPSMPTGQQPTAGKLLSLLKIPYVTLGMAATAFFFMGQFTLFTYLRPFLESVAHVSSNTLSLLLLVIGVAGFIGTTLIGFLLRKALYRTLSLMPLVLAAIAVLLLLFGDVLVTDGILLAIWGLIATAAPVGWWTWLSRALPQDSEAGGGLMVAVIQLAIMLGAELGGRLFDQKGYQATFLASALLLLLAAILAMLTARANVSATP
jgi:predicted MFS family arabinose efflux permease